MTSAPAYDAVIVGSGPNGLAAAITLARAGWSVLVREGAATLGGGARSEALTLPGFLHDVCSAVHPMAAGSPFFDSVPLEKHGLQWIEPPCPVVHPLDGAPAVVAERSVDATAERLGREDGPAYRKLFGSLAAAWPELRTSLLAPPLRVPRHPLLLARFGLHAMRSAAGLARSQFKGAGARALFTGIAAHTGLPLDRPFTASFGLVLATTVHAVGWPIARGGSASITRALASYLHELGGMIETDRPVASLDELPRARAVLCDVTPRQFLAIAGKRLPSRFRRKLERYRYGPGVFKLDWALAAPIPWRDPSCFTSATVHLGGRLDEVLRSEAAPSRGRVTQRPFVLLAQPTLFDATRAPEGKHVAWAYCHVPNASGLDMTDAVEAQIERFAPGFRSRVLARHAMTTADMERHDPNLVGGDVNGGEQGARQLFTRPTRHLYRTPATGLYLCSSSTPPGGGVHGMCGFHAARAVLEDLG